MNSTADMTWASNGSDLALRFQIVLSLNSILPKTPPESHNNGKDWGPYSPLACFVTVQVLQSSNAHVAFPTSHPTAVSCNYCLSHTCTLVCFHI
eukprot:6203730-Pleurochrysis_carterae.AAC.2